jgi:hypothetical protein
MKILVHAIAIKSATTCNDCSYSPHQYGTIDVVSQQGPNASSTSASNSMNSTSIQGSDVTTGVLMVPKSDIDTYVQDLENSGFAIDSTQDFNDIRAGDQQVLLVWTTSGISLDKVVSTLQGITENLPYS